MQNLKIKIQNCGQVIIYTIFFLFVGQTIGFSQNTVTTVVSGSDGATRLHSNIGGISIGYIKVGSEEVGNLAWHPDARMGPFGLGVDVNVALGQNKPFGYEHIVLRYAEYDDGLKGLRYGIIEDLTWGHGLLIKNYSSRVKGPILQNNNQLALKGYLDMEKYVVRGLGTRSNVYGLRVEEKIHPMLTLGQTFITDTDGVNIPGSTEVQKVSALAADATVPLPLNFEGYAEAAQLIGHGSGLSTGISWGMDIMVANASFLTEYRFMESSFIPGYFNSDYETNPVNLASAEATGNIKNGYLAQFGVSALGMASFNAVYENYNESDAAVSADMYIKLPQDIEVAGYYKQPKFVNFRSLTLEEGVIMGGSVAYPLNPYTKFVTHYKKVYNPDTARVEESQYFEVRLSF